MVKIHHSPCFSTSQCLVLELRNQPRSDHRALIFLEVPSPQIRGDDELGERALAVPPACFPRQAEFLAGENSMTSVDDLTLPERVILLELD